MATEFNHNGNVYEIINDKEVRLTKLSNSVSGEVYIPKYARYNDKQYIVTEIGCVEKCSYYRTYDKNASDRRKKPLIVTEWDGTEWASVFRGTYKPTRSSLFPENKTITSLIIPDTVKKINCCAFANCLALEKLILPNSVNFIGNGAFYCCSKLKELILPEGISKIPSHAFYVNILAELTIPNSVKTIGDKSFCSGLNESLTRLTIPSSVEEIGKGAFKLKNLKEVDIYNDPGEVMIAGDAFLSTVKINYLGKKDVKPKSQAEDKTEKAESKTPVSINLDELMQAVIADGVITDKERSVILKKATAAGYDADEVEILLDGKLAEKQNANKVEVKESRTKTEPAKQKETPTTKAATQKSGERTRILSKYSVNGAGSYGKGRMVEAVVNKYVELNPKTIVQKLKEVFPEHLQGSNFIKDSTETITDMKRYYESALPNGEKFYISNQWGTQTDGFVEYVNNNIDGITVTKL